MLTNNHQFFFYSNNQLWNFYRIKEIQCNESSRFANLQSELKIREFEIEHRTCLLSELQEKYNKALLENDKLSEKLNVSSTK